MANKADMRNIRARGVIVDGKVEIHYQVRRQYRDDLGKLRQFVRTFGRANAADNLAAAQAFRDERKTNVRLGEMGDKLTLGQDMQQFTLRGLIGSGLHPVRLTAA